MNSLEVQPIDSVPTEIAAGDINPGLENPFIEYQPQISDLSVTTQPKIERGLFSRVGKSLSLRGVELVLGSSLVLAACGDTKADASTPSATPISPVSVEQTVVVTPTIEAKTPTATPTEVTKPVATEIPKVATAEPSKSNPGELPNKTKEILNSIDSLAGLTSVEREAIKKGLESDISAAKSPTQQYDAVYGAYSALRSKYNSTRDESIKTEMKKLEVFLSSNWNDLYQSDLKGGAYLR